MKIELNKTYLLDNLELQLKRRNENVYVFNIINQDKEQNIHGDYVYKTCIISQRINELKEK
jgi:hypothetical protein